MATEEIVHVPEVLELIPANQLAEFREDLATMDKFYRDLQPLADEATKLQAMPSWDKETRTRAGEIVTEYKRICKDAERTIERYKDIVNRFKEEYILTPERLVTKRAESIKNILTPRMGEWDKREAEEAERERQRIAREKQAELDRLAEIKRQEDEQHAKALRQERVAQIRADLNAGKFGPKKSVKAIRHAQKLLREAGAMEESLKAQAAADEAEAKDRAATTAASVRVESQVPNVRGNVKRVNYSAECFNRVGFIEALAKAKPKTEEWTRLMAMIEVSNQLLSGEARNRIKTSPEDDNPKHDLTVAEFEKLYPFVKVKEDRTY